MAEDEFEEEQDNLSPEQVAKMQRENCIFCKIISGEIPSKKVYEDPDFVGILDINPAADGHVLLLPKQHFQILPQIPQELVGNLGVACSNVSSKILRAFKCDGTSVFMANGAVAGQRAPHFMVHIIPRNDNDNISLNPSLKEIDDSSFNSIKERLFSSMKQPSSKNTNTQTAEFEEIDEQENNKQEQNTYEEDEDLNEKITTNETESDEEEELTENELENLKEPLKEMKNKKRPIKKSEKPAKKKTSKKTEKNKPEPEEDNFDYEEETNQQSNNIDYDKLARMFK